MKDSKGNTVTVGARCVFGGKRKIGWVRDVRPNNRAFGFAGDFMARCDDGPTADDDRPASRDAWVRWGSERDLARVRASLPAGLLTNLDRGDAFNKGARPECFARWSALRDNPEALTVAVCAALTSAEGR